MAALGCEADGVVQQWPPRKKNLQNHGVQVAPDWKTDALAQYESATGLPSGPGTAASFRPMGKTVA